LPGASPSAKGGNGEFRLPADARRQVVINALGLLVDEPKDEAELAEYEENYSHAGNAGEWVDLTNAWIAVVSFKPERDIALIVKLAEARGACVETLAKV